AGRGLSVPAAVPVPPPVAVAALRQLADVDDHHFARGRVRAAGRILRDDDAVLRGVGHRVDDHRDVQAGLLEDPRRVGLVVVPHVGDLGRGRPLGDGQLNLGALRDARPRRRGLGDYDALRLVGLDVDPRDGEALAFEGRLGVRERLPGHVRHLYGLGAARDV